MKKFIIQLLTFVCIVRKTLETCVAGCLSCDSKNNCLVCDASSLYILVAGSCVQNSLQYCALSFTLNACSFCIPGYYLEINRKCTLNTKTTLAVANCYRYVSATRCQQCNKFYYPKDGGRSCNQISTVITKCQIYNTPKTCSVCADLVVDPTGLYCNPPTIMDDNCLFYSNNTVCQSCQSGFWYNENMYLSNIQQTFSAIFGLQMDYGNTFNILTNVQQCSPIIPVPHCIAYQPNSNKCKSCEEGYFLNMKTFQCNMNPVQTASIASIPIPYCFVTSSTTEIINGISQIVTVCSLCYQGYYISVNGNKCAKHTASVANCLIYSQSTNGACLLCTNEYYLNAVNGKIVCTARQVLINCFFPDPMSNKCLTCVNPQYISYYNDQYCAPPIVNCQIYEKNFPTLTCLRCTSTYYFNPISNTCVQNNNYDPYCNAYDSNQVCVLCNYGYYIDPIAKKCTSNTNEYVARCNCQSFSQQVKDTCIMCPLYTTLMPVNNTCKLPPTTLTTDQINSLLNCADYYVDYQGNYICTNAQVYVPSGTYCDATELGCSPNSLNLATNLVVTVSLPLTYCMAYKPSWSGVGDIPCAECKASINHIDYLYTSDACLPAAQMPWCENDQRDQNNLCIKPSGHCALLWYNAPSNQNPSDYNTFDQASTCMVCPTNLAIVPDCFPCCVRSQREKCYKKNGVFQNTPSYRCNLVTVPPSTPPDTPCPDFGQNIACGTPIVYQVYINYEITLAPDNSQCVLENIYFNPAAVCLVVKNFSCLLCIRRYYPVLQTQLPYTMDYVESYYANQIYPNMKNCMMFDQTLGTCTMCDFAASGTRLNNYGVCVACNSIAFVTDIYQTLCLNYVNTDLIYGSCFKIDAGRASSYCIQCMSETYAEIYNFNVNTNEPIYDVDYLYSAFNVPTYIGNKVDAYSVSSCIYKSLMFVDNIAYTTQNQYCDWGYSVSKINYCLKCVFGYAGQLSTTSAGVYFLQNCVKNDNWCNNDVYYTFNLRSVRYYLSCHVCQNTVNIPTLYMYNDYAKPAATVKFLFSNTAGPSATTFQCNIKFNSLPPSCAAQMFINDPNLLSKVSLNAYLCLSCLPAYASLSWTVISDGSYPYSYTTNCAAISNCADSNITNVCQQCLPNYNLINSGSACAPNPVGHPELQFCNVILTSNGVYTCSACKNGYKYLQIATNSATPLYSCLPYVVANCQYYAIDQCLQSTKQIGIGYNVLIRRTNYNYYINQSNCKPPESPIPNCRFYLNKSTCYLCNSGYYLGNAGTQCYQRTDPKCMVYNDNKMACQTCVPGYTLSTNGCSLSDIPANTIPYCINYSQGYCSACSAGYTPIIVRNGQTSVCISNYISKLCEVVNINGIQANNVISCARCKTLATIKSDLANKVYSLDQYDFMSYNDYQAYVSSGTINYSVAINQMVYLRAAINLQPRGTNFCQNFGGVANCVLFDSIDLTHTFVCLQCDVDKYYLSNLQCRSRTEIKNCLKYNPNENNCLQFLDTTDATITYSVLDNIVMKAKISNFPGFGVNSRTIFGCVAFFDLNTCSQCNSTTWLYNNLCLNVSTPVSDCVIYGADGICNACKENRLLLQNKCLIIYAKNCLSYLTNTKCLTCPQTYPMLDASGSCTKNEQIPDCLIYDTPTYCYQCALPYINDNGFCIFGTIIPNCINIFTNRCRQCGPGYIVSWDKSSCVINPNYDRNCNVFLNKNICIVCQQRYYLSNGQCVPCQTDPITCYFCNPANPTACIVCSPGFFMDRSGTCNIVVGYVPPLLSLLNQNSQLVSSLNR